jgi:hypothetical protein
MQRCGAAARHVRRVDARRGGRQQPARHEWRCPTGVQALIDVGRADRLHPLCFARESQRFKDLYRSGSAVEHQFGRLKHASSFLPLPVRGIELATLHADLADAAKARALARAHSVPPAA